MPGMMPLEVESPNDNGNGIALLTGSGLPAGTSLLWKNGLHLKQSIDFELFLGFVDNFSPEEKPFDFIKLPLITVLWDGHSGWWARGGVPACVPVLFWPRL